MPRFLEGKAGAKSLYNQFGWVATECHIFCEEEFTTVVGLSQVHIWQKKSPTALEVVSCEAIYSFSGGFEEGCFGFTCHRKSSAYRQVAATATL